jgi:hypothetical protein
VPPRAIAPAVNRGLTLDLRRLAGASPHA